MISHYGVVTPAAVRNAYTEGAADSEATDIWRIGPQYSSSFEAYVPIRNGCDKYCTFCAVPYTRGPEVSRPSDHIIDEIRGLLDKGYVSFTLLGQNVSSYGKDQPGTERTFAARQLLPARTVGFHLVPWDSSHDGVREREPRLSRGIFERDFAKKSGSFSPRFIKLW